MVYTGQPSKGCATCRKRRIKCDEQVPQCGACLRVKQECPGYKNHFDLAWRDQTSVAKKGVERGKAKRKAARERQEAAEKSKLESARKISYAESSSSGSNSPGRVFTPESRHSSPSSSGGHSPPPVQDLWNPQLSCDPYLTILRPIPGEQALNFFFSNYVFPTRDPLARRGFFEYLGSIYMNSDKESPVKVSTMAVAISLMSGRMGQPADTPLSRSYYLQAVTHIKELVTQQRDCTSNELIFAVMLLQFYEATVGQLMKRSSTKQPHPHLDGAIALIRHRGPWNFKDPVSGSLLLYVRSLLVSEIDDAFKNHISIPEDIRTWSDYVPESEQIPGFRLDTINLDLANLQAKASSVIRSPLSPFRTSQLLEVYEQAFDIDSRLYDWSQTLPESWYYTRIFRENNIHPGLQLYQDYCDIYRTLFLASTWNRLRLSQIGVQNAILSCLKQLPSTPANLTNQAVCQETIQQLADDICASVPFYLGDRMKPGRQGDPDVQYPRAPGKPKVVDHYHTGPAMGGWSLLIPLGTLTKMDIELREGQRGWIAGQMARTARIYNISNFPPKGPPKGPPKDAPKSAG